VWPATFPTVKPATFKVSALTAAVGISQWGVFVSANVHLPVTLLTAITILAFASNVCRFLLLIQLPITASFAMKLSYQAVCTASLITYVVAVDLISNSSTEIVVAIIVYI